MCVPPFWRLVCEVRGGYEAPRRNRLGDTTLLDALGRPTTRHRRASSASARAARVSDPVPRGSASILHFLGAAASLRVVVAHQSATPRGKVGRRYPLPC